VRGGVSHSEFYILGTGVTAQIDPRPSRAPITSGAVTKVVRTVHCAALIQETPQPHRGLCGPLTPTSPAFLRAVNISRALWANEGTPAQALQKSRNCSGRFPAITSTYHLCCGDHFRRQPRPAPLAMLGRQSPDQREVPPPPNSRPCITLLSPLDEGYPPSALRVQPKIRLSSLNLRVHQQVFHAEQLRTGHHYFPAFRNSSREMAPSLSASNVSNRALAPSLPDAVDRNSSQVSLPS